MTGADLADGLARGLHVAATMSLFGTAIVRAICAPPALALSEFEVRRSVEGRLTRLVWASFIIAAVAGNLWLVAEAANLAPDSSAASILQAIPTVLRDTHFGPLLISRLGLLLIACFLMATQRLPWVWAAAGLAGLAVGLQAGLGHGLSMGGSTGALLTVGEVFHLLSAGAWLGGLPALFLLVRLMPPMA